MDMKPQIDGNGAKLRPVWNMKHLLHLFCNQRGFLNKLLQFRQRTWSLNSKYPLIIGHSAPK